MFRYPKYLDFQDIITAHTKDYLPEALCRLLPDYAKSKYRIAQIGAGLYLDNLSKLRASERYGIDPYK